MWSSLALRTVTAGLGSGSGRGRGPGCGRGGCPPSVPSARGGVLGARGPAHRWPGPRQLRAALAQRVGRQASRWSRGCRGDQAGRVGGAEPSCSRAASRVAGRELWGVAPRAARGAGGSWGSARWRWSRGARPASPGRAWSQLSLPGAGRRGCRTCLVCGSHRPSPAGRSAAGRRVWEVRAAPRAQRARPAPPLPRRGAGRAAGALPAAPE